MSQDFQAILAMVKQAAATAKSELIHFNYGDLISRLGENPSFAGKHEHEEDSSYGSF